MRLTNPKHGGVRSMRLPLSNQAEIYQRLAAYEDSGLSPEQVQEIAKALKQAIADMALIAGDVISEKKCYICKYYTDGEGCELDGSQFDDDGECHFTWHGTQATAEVVGE